MKIKTLERLGLVLIFIIGGFYGFTDINGPRNLGTLLGSALVVMLISLTIGWAVNKVLSLFNIYKNKFEKINRKISLVIVIGIIVSLILLTRGIMDFYSY